MPDNGVSVIRYNWRSSLGSYQVCRRQLNYLRRFRAPKMRDRVGYMCGCLV